MLVRRPFPSPEEAGGKKRGGDPSQAEAAETTLRRTVESAGKHADIRILKQVPSQTLDP